MANKGVAAYRAWKSVRNMEGWDSSEPFGQILSYNNWLTVMGTPPPVFHKCSFQRVLSSLERTLVEVLILRGLSEL